MAFLPMTDLMKFGDYLRQRRNELGWTQPEAAARAGIEQSYLSKLETGRSTPSEEVYQKLEKALGLDLAGMVDVLAPAELERLRDIEAVRDQLLTLQSRARSGERRWHFAGLAMLMFGGGLLGLAQVDRGGNTTQYTYQSTGVILPGESLDLFAGIDDERAPPQSGEPDAGARQQALLKRIDEQTRITAEMRGPSFIETTPAGRRVWTLVGGSDVARQDRFGWAYAPALALIVGGLACFFIGWRKP